MTCIIALRDINNKTYHLYGDKLWVSNENIINDYSSKIVDYNNMQIGCAGDYYGYIFSLDYSEEIYNVIKALYNGNIKYIEASNQIKNLCDNSFIDKTQTSFNLLISYCDALYLIYPDFLITPITTDYYAIGSGREVALGAMWVCMHYIDTDLKSLSDIILSAVEHTLIDVGTK